MMTSLENKVKGIFEGFQEPYLLLGVSGTIYWANTAFWERIDISQENSDKTKLKLCNELCDEKHINEFLSLLSKGKTFRFSLENYDTRGGKYILDLDAQPFEHEGENSEALFLIAAKEITQIEKDRKRLKLLEAALTVADDVVLISEAEPIDGGGPKVIDVNPAFTKMTGYEKEEIIGKTPRILQGPKTSPEEKAKIRKALEEWKPVEAELINYKKDGTPFSVNLKIAPIADDTGWFTHWVAVQRDITTRKNREAELKKNQEKLRSIITSVDDLIFVLDDTGKIIDYSQAFDYIDLQPATEGLPGKHYTRVFPRVMIDQIERAYQDMKPTRPVMSYEFRMEIQDSIRWFSVRVARQKLDDARLTGLAFAVRDISSLKETEESLRRSEELLEATQRIAQIGGWEFYPETGEIIWTKQTYHIHGLPYDAELDFELIMSFMPNKDAQRLGKAVEKALETGEGYDLELKFINKQGQHMYVRGIGTAERKNGKTVKLSGTIQDITHHKNTELRLQTREEELEKITQNVPGAIYKYRIDREGKSSFTYVSKGVEELFSHYSRDEMVSDADILFNSFHPEDVQVIAAEIEYSRQYLTDFMVEYRVFDANREIRWHQASSKPELKEDGSVVWYGIFQDITQRKNAESELKRLTDRFSLAVDGAQIGVWDLNLITQELIWDERMYSIFGVKPEDFTGKLEDFMTLLHPADIKRVGSIISAAEKQHEKFSAEFRIITPEGELRYIHATAVVVRDAEGKAERITGINYDITESKLTQDRLSLLQSVVENNQDPILITQAEPIAGELGWSEIVYVNSAFEKSFGYKQKEVIGSTPGFLHGPKTNRSVLGSIEEILNKCQTYETDLIHYRKNGEEIWINLNLFPVADQSGDFTHWVALMRDITNRKQEEFELIQAKEQAEASSQAKSEFLSTMSHEIRTPLNAVIGMTGLMAETKLDEEQESYLQTIRQGGENLLSVINDILDYSKIESGKLELEHIDFNLAEPVEDTLDLLASRAYEKGIELLYNIDESVPHTVKGDITRLRQVLVNLVGNAIKFTQEGEVVVSARSLLERGSWTEILFSVRDTGMGIPEDKLDRLFKSFSQVDASITRKHGGTGLGLAISQKLVQLQGGSIWVESEVGKGSTFFFTIIAEIAQQQNLNDKEYSLLGKKQVMIVDDNETNLTILEKQLLRLGIEVDTFASPKEALKIVQNKKALDLLLVDLNMPEMDGLSFGEEVRKLYSDKSLPMILLSSGNTTQSEGQKAIFDVILQKPARKKDLYRHMHRLLLNEGPAKQKEVANPEKNDEVDLSGHHILLVEDNIVNQRVAVKMLHKFKAKVEVANNGQEALDYVKLRPFDLILMDMQMPVMDGLTSTIEIRKFQDINQPLILAMTANASEEDKQKCFDAGMNDFISKPIKLQALKNYLTKWLLSPAEV